MHDRVESFNGATIQHGPYNQRIYVMKMGEADPAVLPRKLAEFAHAHGYTKVFAKVPRSAAAPFLANGYRIEAEIPHFFADGQSAAFLGCYPDPARAVEPEPGAVEETLRLARQKAGEASAAVPPLPEGCRLRPCTEADIPAMSRIYSAVFPSYPFPIEQPDYLLETMRSRVDYFGVERGDDGLEALSSAEMDRKTETVEMTDFATLPRGRGNGHAVSLLSAMEDAMAKCGLRTAYTIARALSPGMNITFARRGYTYAGTLTNNTNISGRIESMNIWHKPLRRE